MELSNRDFTRKLSPFFFIAMIGMACQQGPEQANTASVESASHAYDSGNSHEASNQPFTYQPGPVEVLFKLEQVGSAEGKFIKLFETEGKDFFEVDSAQVENGSFQFSLENVTPGFYKVGLNDNVNTYGDIILNPSEPDVEFIYENVNFKRSLKGTNSKETLAYRTYLQFDQRHERYIQNIRRSKVERTAKLRQMRARDAQLKTQQDSLAAIHQGMYIANVMAHLQSPSRFDKNEFWKDMDFSDASLIHSYVYPDRIEDYMRNIASKEKSESDPKIGFYNAVDVIAQKVMEGGNDEILEFALYTMAEGFYASGMEDLSVYVVDNYFYGDACGDAEISELFKMKADGIRKLQIGQVPPSFARQSDKGKMVDLSKIAKDNKYTLVLFWASFCHKCEREIPTIKQAYAQYHNKGFEVVAVSVDTDLGEWKDGIASHGTTWPNVCSGKSWRGPIAEDYRVTSTPVMYLLDSEQRIVAKPKNALEVSQFLGRKL